MPPIIGVSGSLFYQARKGVRQMTEISRPAALQRFFSTPEKPVSAKELLELRKADLVGFDKLADACLGALTPKKQAA